MKAGFRSLALIVTGCLTLGLIPAVWAEVDELTETLIRDGAARVIVQLAVPVAPEARLSGHARKQQHQAIRQAQLQLVDDVIVAHGVDETTVKAFRYTPGLALEADAATVAALRQHPAVADVVIDRADPPQLMTTIGLIGAAGPAAAGQTGAGQVVAVLDTGIDKTHPFLAGKVVSEACYSTTSSTNNSTSLCPGGASSSTAVDSGLDCAPGTAAGCGHGTHVAGIAAGTNGASSSGTIHGVGRGADLVAVQVFSRFTGSNCGSGPSPCVLAYISDQILGLERVYDLRNSLAIASANMSLGGGQHGSACDGDSRKPIIDNLRAAGIATVIATGNNGYNGAIGAPACISTAIAVGATTKQDAVWSSSNISSLIDLLAPGASICSSVVPGISSSCGSGYAFYWGTSMAAPHVAGAWAVVRQAAPFASVDEILEAFQVSGQPISSSAGPLPRIQLDQALLLLPEEIFADGFES